MIIGKDRILIYDFGFTNYDLVGKSEKSERPKEKEIFLVDVSNCKYACPIGATCL